MLVISWFMSAWTPVGGPQDHRTMPSPCTVS